MTRISRRDALARLAAIPLAAAFAFDRGALSRAAGLPAQGGGDLTPDGKPIGRNDPCWCGSGKKYKKCHGAG